MARDTGLATKVAELRKAAELSDGRADAGVVEEAKRVSTQVDRRLAFAGDATVVALAGATGSGKSSTFNAVSGTTLARTGVRRPTTSTPLAATWGDGSSADMTALLDWLEIPERHSVVGGDPALAGLVLLDLPDHDSTELSNRMQVDRLVKLVDMFVWVVDPQKYADGALHDNYLKPLATHADVMMVVLNQADRLSEQDLNRTLKDLRALLDSEGLGKAEVFAVSAKTGMGIDELRKRLARIVKDKKASAKRLGSDVEVAAKALQGELGTGKVPAVRDDTIKRLSAELAVASGAGQVEEAVKKAWRRRGSLATGWPVVAWVAKLRPDPLRRLHLDQIPAALGSKAKELEPVRDQRTSLPHMGGVAQARVDNAIRAIGEEASAGLPRGWAEKVRDAARTDQKHLPDELDRAIARTDLGMDSGRGWWWIIRVLQWILMIAMVVGLGWLALIWALAYFQFPPLIEVRWHNLPLATWLAIGGAAGGIVLSILSRIFVEWGARVKGAAAGRALRKAIADVTRAQVVAPVEEELSRYRQARESLDRVV